MHRGAQVKLSRDLVMFLLGLAAFLNETIRGTDRPNIIYGSLALMGVAAYLRGVETAKRANGNGAS